MFPTPSAEELHDQPGNETSHHLLTETLPSSSNDSSTISFPPSNHESINKFIFPSTADSIQITELPLPKLLDNPLSTPGDPENRSTSSRPPRYPPSKLAGMKVSAMLTPTRMALSFLHGEHMVGNGQSSNQGQSSTLQPSSHPVLETKENLLAVRTPVKKSISLESKVSSHEKQVALRSKSPSSAYLSSALLGYGSGSVSASARKKTVVVDDFETIGSLPLLTEMNSSALFARVTELEESNKVRFQNLQYLLKDREKELEVFRERFYDIQSELRARERALAEKDREISEKERKHLENNQLEQSLRDTVGNMQVSMNLHEFQVNLLKTQLQEHASKVKSLEVQLSAKDVLLQSDQEKKRELKQDLEAKHLQLRERDLEMQRWQHQLAQMQMEIKTLTDRVETLQEEKKKFKAQLATQVLEIVQQSFQKPIKSLAFERIHLLEEFHTYKLQVDSLMQKIQPSVRQLVASNSALVQSYNKEREIRKKLQNDLIELKGNIRVFCRIRPPFRTAENCMEVHLDGSEEKLLVKSNDQSNKFESSIFHFDRVFSNDSTQASVFADVQPFIQSCIDGYNVCIFAYGQTGSGLIFVSIFTQTRKDIYNGRTCRKSWSQLPRFI